MRLHLLLQLIADTCSNSPCGNHKEFVFHFSTLLILVNPQLLCYTATFLPYCFRTFDRGNDSKEATASPRTMMIPPIGSSLSSPGLSSIASCSRSKTLL